EKAILINGLPEMPIHNISMVNLTIQSDEGIVCRHADELELKNVSVECRRGAAGLFHQCSRVEINGLEIVTASEEDRILEVTGAATEQLRYAEVSVDLQWKPSSEVKREELI